MPIYNFLCENCKDVSEQIVFDLETEIVECDKCGGPAVKQFSMPETIHFQLLYDPKKDICAWGNEGYNRTRRYEQYDKMKKGNIFPVTGRK